jgi:Fe-S oxidoreductase
MSTPLLPAHAQYAFLPGKVLFTILPIVAIAIFSYVVYRRVLPLLNAPPDPRGGRVGVRVRFLLRNWLLQWKHPRYLAAGLLHIVIFAGFLILSIRSVSLVLMGIFPGLQLEQALGPLAPGYDFLKDYAATAVFAAVVVAAIRRKFFPPARYAPRFGDPHNHTAEALFILGLIGTLMVAESVFDASAASPFTLANISGWSLAHASPSLANQVRLGAYLVHEITFFLFLCLLPFGKHFHVVTSLFNIYFLKLDRGTVKPVRWDVPEDQLDQLKSFGVRRLEDFTWKHQLDFLSCADCGRCSDNCPANAAGRPLSPRFLTIKARDLAYSAYPAFGKKKDLAPLVGSIYTADEIWSCTTCGACEEECPMQVEYIDKIVDLRRALVEDGEVPRTLQKPLKALESRGNPYGKLEKKRGDWAKATDTEPACAVKTLDGRTAAETLFFVDSVSCYDDRIQRVTRATARLLAECGEDFGILGTAERDSGHDVRRFGEESLFQALREQNTEAIQNAGVARIVTSDPHALNALRHDYHGVPEAEHISQLLARKVKQGALKLHKADSDTVVAYHDPCYLGRHNQVYDEPRAVLDAIPGLKRVEMQRCRDRSFCCGGGGLMLYYEAQEKERIGALRVKMAAEAGANTIITACPFCLVNVEDAIKVTGMEDQMRAMDLTELLLQHIPNLPVAEQVLAAAQMTATPVAH